MKVDGACHCGNIKFEAEIDPARVSICNCTDCQVISGSPYRVSVPVPAGKFKMISGKPSVYVKTAESGAKRAHSFCPNCGTPIFGTDPGDAPSQYMLRVGTLRQRAQLAPKRQIWTRSALAWSRDVSDIQGFERQPPA